MDLLNVRDIRKNFQGVRAIQGCSLSVAKGSITGLIGPNGAGKTTLFNVISGVYRPDKGQIRFAGDPIDGLPSHIISRKGLMRTFQIPRVLNHMTVQENLLLYSKDQVGERLWNNILHYRRVVRQERNLRRQAHEILEFVNLYHLRHAYAEELSGGQKKLLELARVLMADPTMILLDEPGAGVNPTLMKELVKRIQKLQERGITFFLIEHDMDLVLRLCDDVIVMAEGRRLTEGSFEEISRDKRVLEAYLGKGKWDS
jgi:branched-chain amino acid transport system ATP-binding protein